MTTVTIFPVPTKKGTHSYFAMAGEKQSTGQTAGAALDALTQQLTERESSTLVIIQMPKGDDGMQTLTIQADKKLLNALKKIAKRKHTSVEAVAKEALLSYVQLQPSTKKKTYSIIGIAHSGKGNLSVEAENILEQSANRREGWSLPE